MNLFKLPSLKITAKAPENWWFENKFSLGTRPIFREDVLVSFRECKYAIPRSLSSHVLNSVKGGRCVSLENNMFVPHVVRR